MVGAVRDPGRFLDWADVVLLVRKNKIGEVLGIVLKAATPKTNHMQPFLDSFVTAALATSGELLLYKRAFKRLILIEGLLHHQ